MKLLIVTLALLTAACAPAPQAPTGNNAPPTTIDDAPEVDHTCMVYDACSYNTSGLSKTPRYLCSNVTLTIDDPQGLPLEVFDGHECVTLKQDYRQITSFCGPAHFPCTVLQQGPGPEAIPGFEPL